MDKNSAMIDIDKIIEEVTNQHTYKERGNRDSYSPYNEGWSDACDILGEKIKQALVLSDVVGESEQLTCPDCKTDDVFIWPKYNLNKCHQCLHEWAR